MEPSSGGSTSAAAPADTSAATASSDSDPSAALMGGGDPSAATPPATTAAAADPADPKPAKGGKGGKGGALSKAECQQVSDKGVDLLLAGMSGLDPSMAAQVKAQAANDPNMAGMMTECLKSTTRAQYKCSMAAKSKGEWETCLK